MTKFNLFICCAAFILLPSCAKKPKPPSADQREAIRQAAFLKFASDQQAIIHWKDELPSQSADFAFTLQLQNALIRSDNKPIAFRGELLDVMRHGSGYFLRIRSADGELFLTLEATPSQVEQVTHEVKDNLFEEYAVAARIQHVERVAFRVQASEDGDPDAVDVNASDRFVVKGQCVGLMHLEGE